MNRRIQRRRYSVAASTTVVAREKIGESPSPVPRSLSAGVPFSFPTNELCPNGDWRRERPVGLRRVNECAPDGKGKDDGEQQEGVEWVGIDA